MCNANGAEIMVDVVVVVVLSGGGAVRVMEGEGDGKV